VAEGGTGQRREREREGRLRASPERGDRGRVGRERGWAGILAFLIVLCIGALIAGAALRTFSPDGKSSSVTRGPAKAPSELDAPDTGTATAPAPPAAPMEKARGLQDAVQQQADDVRRRIDAQDR
jgi:hypothetical protein